MASKIINTFWKYVDTGTVLTNGEKLVRTESDCDAVSASEATHYAEKRIYLMAPGAITEVWEITISKGVGRYHYCTKKIVATIRN